MCLLDYQRRDRQLAIGLMLTNAERRSHILRTKRIHLSVLKAETDNKKKNIVGPINIPVR